MANDNIKRYLDYDGLAYLITKFNSVIEANEYTTSEALNNLNQKIAELTDNTGGFPIIDADITQIDSVYTTTENLNELITPGQYIVDSSKIQYDGDNFVKTLYWLLSVDKVIYNNSESIVQTYYPLSYLTYSWHDIPVGGLLQRFYEGNNTWTDLQVAAPGDVDPSKFVEKTEFNETVETLVSKTEFNETITPYTENIKFIEISEPIFTTAYSLSSGEYTITTNNTEPVDNLFEAGIYYIRYNNALSSDGSSGFNGITYILHILKTTLNSVDYISQIFELYNPGQFYGNPRSLRFCRYYDPSNQKWSDPEEIEFSKKLNQPVLYNTESSKESGKEPGYIDPEEEFIYVLKDPITTGDDKDMSLYLTGYGDSHRIELKIHKSYSMPTKNYVINNYVSNQTLSTTLNDYVSNQTLTTTLNDYISKDNISSYIPSDIITASNISSNLPSEVITTSNISSNLPSTVITTSNISSNLPSTVITTSNISSNLPSTVITTNNIPSHISSSNSFKFKDSGGALIEYVVHSEKDNILSTQQLGVNTDYNIICRPDHINTWNNNNIVSSYYNTQLLRLKFGTTFFHDIFVDPNSEYIMHRSVRANTAFDWQLLLDTKNISKWFGSTLPGSSDMVNKVTETIITGKNIKPASIDATGKITAGSIDVTGNINVGGGVFETSDETLKDFQDSIQVNFEQLKEIPKAYFTFKDDKTGETKIGTSAQKVKEFYPELVSEDKNGILSVDYAKLSIVALKAVDELDNRLSKLEKLVEQLLNNKY